MHCARKPHGLVKLDVELVKMTSGENGENEEISLWCNFGVRWIGKGHQMN